MRILVVDDDKMARKIIFRSLERRGYTVSEASDGDKALAVMKEEDIGVVIADWMMPKMDGIALSRHIRADNKSGYVFIIMLTSKGETEDFLHGFKAGVDAYMAKPPKLDELEAQIKAGMRIVGLERRVSRYALEMESLAQERAEQLVHADRMATLGTLGTLSAGIAHEVNNPTTLRSAGSRPGSFFRKRPELCMTLHP